MTDDAWPILVFAESDYRYGTGPLTLRIERVVWERPVQYDGEIWYPVEGMQISRLGAERGRRHTLVRARRLPRPPPQHRLPEPP